MAGWMNRKRRPWAGSSPEGGGGEKEAKTKAGGGPRSFHFEDQVEEEEEEGGPVQGSRRKCWRNGKCTRRGHDRYQGKRKIREGGSEQL